MTQKSEARIGTLKRVQYEDNYIDLTIRISRSTLQDDPDFKLSPAKHVFGVWFIREEASQ